VSIGISPPNQRRCNLDRASRFVNALLMAAARAALRKNACGRARVRCAANARMSDFARRAGPRAGGSADVSRPYFRLMRAAGGVAN